jgi:hypothetical protein
LPIGLKYRPIYIKEGMIFGALLQPNKPNMNREFYGLDLDTLQAMYQEETNRLKDELLAGAPWDSLQERKTKVTELAITIHRKKYPLYFNPAEFSSREEQPDNSSMHFKNR